MAAVFCLHGETIFECIRMDRSNDSVRLLKKVRFLHETFEFLSFVLAQISNVDSELRSERRNLAA